MPFQADLPGLPVMPPRAIGRTGLGTACRAGLATGVDHGPDELSARWQVERRILPTMDRTRARAPMAPWGLAVRQAVTV